MIESYSKIYNLGRPEIAELLKGPVTVSEKIDGSQLSFALTDDGQLEMRSKGQQLNLLDPEKLFLKAVESISSIKNKLVPGFTYRGEYLAAPHHNVLTYSRVPKSNIILFDVQCGSLGFANPYELKAIAESLGLECVPFFMEGIVSNESLLRGFLNFESILGGQKIEGVVIKPAKYDLFGRDGKVLMGKYVSPQFKEVHSATWKKEHKTPDQTEIIAQLASKYGTPARYNKALIHLKERGLLKCELSDIGLLMKEVPDDVLQECKEMIEGDLMRWAWPQLKRAITRPVPEWYKAELAHNQFKQGEAA